MLPWSHTWDSLGEESSWAIGRKASSFPWWTEDAEEWGRGRLGPGPSSWKTSQLPLCNFSYTSLENSHACYIPPGGSSLDTEKLSSSNSALVVLANAAKPWDSNGWNHGELTDGLTRNLGWVESISCGINGQTPCNDSLSSNVANLTRKGLNDKEWEKTKISGIEQYFLKNELKNDEQGMQPKL